MGASAAAGIGCHEPPNSCGDLVDEMGDEMQQDWRRSWAVAEDCVAPFIDEAEPLHGRMAIVSSKTLERSRISPWTRDLIGEANSGVAAATAPDGYQATSAAGDMIVETPEGTLLLGREATLE